MLGVQSQDVKRPSKPTSDPAYINDFNMYGRTYQVTAQADLSFRRADDLTRIKVRKRDGRHGAARQCRDVRRRRRRRSRAALQSVPGDGDQRRHVDRCRCGYGVARWRSSPERSCRTGIGFEWTDLTYQQTTTGNMGLLIFPLSVMFVYLVLAAQYASWSLPLAIVLIVPMCLLAAIAGVRCWVETSTS